LFVFASVPVVVDGRVGRPKYKTQNTNQPNRAEKQNNENERTHTSLLHGNKLCQRSNKHFRASSPLHSCQHFQLCISRFLDIFLLNSKILFSFQNVQVSTCIWASLLVNMRFLAIYWHLRNSWNKKEVFLIWDI